MKALQTSEMLMRRGCNEKFGEEHRRGRKNTGKNTRKVHLETSEVAPKVK